MYSVTNGYCKIFINPSAYKNCEFLIQSSILLLNFILSLARSVGMWLQSKLKSDHIWITFPHECNNFRRLMNVRPRLSHRMRLPRWEAQESWCELISLFYWSSGENACAHNRLGTFLRTGDVLCFHLSKSNLQNTIPVCLRLWEWPQEKAHLWYHVLTSQVSISQSLSSGQILPIWMK